MSKSTLNSGETTPTGVLTPSTVIDSETSIPDFTICKHREPKTDAEILERIAELRLALSEPKRLLVSPMPDVTKQHPAIGTLTFSPNADVIRIKTQVNIPYVTSRDVSTSKPAIITAIRGFAKPHATEDLCLFVSPTNQLDSTFDMQFTGWMRSNINKIQVDWLEIPEQHTKSGMWQHGEHIFNFRANNPRQLSTKIKFTKAFSSPPIVVIWLSGIHSEGSRLLRIMCGKKGDKVGKGEFEPFVETWDDTILYDVKISWVAYDRSLKGVYSASVDTDLFRSHRNPQHFNTRYTAFPAGQFTKAPKVMVGATALDLCNQKEQNVHMYASDVTHMGMCWNANSWGETRNYKMGLTYLAIEDWRD